VDERIDVIVLLYLATEAAKSYLKGHLDTLGRLAFGTPAYRMTVGADLEGGVAALAAIGSV
jgi:hypothetical protein